MYLIWRMVKLMPRTAPAALKPEQTRSCAGTTSPASRRPKAELIEIVEFLREPERFAKLGARVPKGVLLHGPPGTGKTLLAKAVAGESGAAFFSQSASAFVEMYAGLGAARIRKLFETARKHAPAIIFIDELDAVGAARQSTAASTASRTRRSTSCSSSSTASRRADVVIMASTNRLDTLDAGAAAPRPLRPPGLVSPPDLTGAEQILDVHTRDKPLADDVDLDAIARATSGLTGADLANICNEAAIRAGRAPAATHHRARLRRRARARRRRPADAPRDLREGEADHRLPRGGARAARAHLGRGMTVHKVTIVPRGGALGYRLYTARRGALPRRRARS